MTRAKSTQIQTKVTNFLGVWTASSEFTAAQNQYLKGKIALRGGEWDHCATICAIPRPEGFSASGRVTTVTSTIMFCVVSTPAER